MRGFVAELLNANRRLFFAGIACTLVAGAFEGAGLLLLVPILMLVLGGSSAQGTAPEWLRSFLESLAIPGGPDAQLMFLVSGFVALVMLRGATMLARDSVLARLKIDFVLGLRSELLRRIAETPAADVARLQHGRISHLVSGDIQACGAAAQGSVQIVVAGIMLAAQLAVALTLAPLFTLFTLALLGLAGLALVPMALRASRAGQGVTNENVGLVATLLAFLGTLKLAITQDLQRFWLNDLRDRQERLARHQLAFSLQLSRSSVALATVAALIGAVAVLAGHHAGLSPAVLLVMIVILSRIGGPLSQIQQGAQLLAHSLPAYAEVRRAGDEFAPAAGPPAGEDRDPPVGPIGLERLTYIHGARENGQGVRDITLKIAPGEVVALSGPSGAGKTTLAELIAGLLVPQAGHVSVAGVPIDSFGGGWRRRVGYATQDTLLFHGSMRENLVCGHHRASDASLRAALALVEGSELVTRLEHGMETIIGDRGALLSGGERQRVALARTLLREPRLLILDEATNALDEETERRILLKLIRLDPRPSILFVSHRTRNFDLCDRVLRLAGGELPHDQPALGLNRAATP
ncbi:MAG: ATP-binding cassette domain-containing protein [Allosphingosinicella sp.]|uniref:ATP-binding cassette domain-containing protein n=1 Tax=Allosphingosinicella sp. TaxID=2823234 RepID=UPI003946D7A0